MLATKYVLKCQLGLLFGHYLKIWNVTLKILNNARPSHKKIYQCAKLLQFFKQSTNKMLMSLKRCVHRTKLCTSYKSNFKTKLFLQVPMMFLWTVILEMNKWSELINLAIKLDLTSVLNHLSTEFYLMINNRLGKIFHMSYYLNINLFFLCTWLWI